MEPSREDSDWVWFRRAVVLAVFLAVLGLYAMVLFVGFQATKTLDGFLQIALTGFLLAVVAELLTISVARGKLDEAESSWKFFQRRYDEADRWRDVGRACIAQLLAVAEDVNLFRLSDIPGLDEKAMMEARREVNVFCRDRRVAIVETLLTVLKTKRLAAFDVCPGWRQVPIFKDLVEEKIAAGRYGHKRNPVPEWLGELHDLLETLLENERKAEAAKV